MSHRSSFIVSASLTMFQISFQDLLTLGRLELLKYLCQVDSKNKELILHVSRICAPRPITVSIILTCMSFQLFKFLLFNWLCITIYDYIDSNAEFNATMKLHGGVPDLWCLQHIARKHGTDVCRPCKSRRETIVHVLGSCPLINGLITNIALTRH